MATFCFVLPPSQDVKNLEQSVYFGVADFLRRQGDVQLDIDDMSCEVKYMKTGSRH